MGGLSGFPRTSESPCDAFNTGHSSTSISAALGMAHAGRLNGTDEKIVAVIGDGALTGGLAYEALNNASALKSNIIIVLNDNNMSISENVGGLSETLGALRTADGYMGLKDNIKNALNKIPGGSVIEKGIHRTKEGIKQAILPGMFFEELGIKYLGPIDGHDMQKMLRAFNEASRVEGPVVVHVITKKGKGYPPAEKHPDRFHGTGRFAIDTGRPLERQKSLSYSDVFSSVMRKLARENKDLVAVTAAMGSGVGLNRFKDEFPDRFFDVGIAEGHAATFAAGLSAAGKIPVFAVYSSFLQRAYDEIVHDVCMQDLHVIFAVDRAGIVGEDGATHHGLLDIAFASNLPNVILMAPKNKWELYDMMRWAIGSNHPVIIRYPKGTASEIYREKRTMIEEGKAEILHQGRKVALWAYGSMVEAAEEVRGLLEANDIDATLINARFSNPVDMTLIRNISRTHEYMFTMEEGVRRGGFGEYIIQEVSVNEIPLKVMNFGVSEEKIDHGKRYELLEALGLNPEVMAEQILAEVDI